MSTTSKPAVTPEMVEKARLWLDGEMNEYGLYAPCACDNCAESYARFAASAVQDAVNGCAEFIKSPMADNGYAVWGSRLAAALREKYGLEGQ